MSTVEQPILSKLGSFALLVALMSLGLAHGQTRVDLRSQSKSVDFSGADSTRPIKTGAALPATCGVGDLFFLTSAPPGQNLYACATTGTWSTLAGAIPTFAQISGVAALSQGGTAATTAAGARANLGAAATVHTHVLTDLTGITGKQGSAGTIQIFGGGAVSTNDCAKFDSSGNLVDAGIPCGGSNATSIQGNTLDTTAPSSAGQFYAWNPAAGQLSLFTPGALLSVSGKTINVATDSVPQYATSASLPASCSQYGLLYFLTTGGAGNKLYYCNGATYEQVQSGSPGLADPGSNGLLKRTAANTTAVASAGVDYYAPGTAVAATDLPNPGTSSGGKVQAKNCTAGQFVSAINTDSTVACGTPPAGLADPGSNGILARTSAGATVARTITAGSSNISITGGDGSSNPTIDLGPVLDLSGKATVPNQVGNTSALPSTCTVGQTFFNFSATAGQNMYYCTAANTWTQQLNSGGTAGFGASLFSSTSSATVTGTTAATLIGSVTGSTTIAANTFTAGQFLQIQVEGYYTTPAAYAGTLTINLKIGGVTRLTTGGINPLANVAMGVWRLNCGVTTRTSGPSGTQIANCLFETTGSSLSALTPAQSAMTATAAWTIDTTASAAIDMQAAWSTTAGSPSITGTNAVAWIPGAPVTSVSIDGGPAQTGTVALTSKVTSVFGQSGVVGAVGDLNSSAQVVQIGGAAIPASAGLTGTNSARQLVAASAHNVSAPLSCADSSGSGTAQSCATSPSFTPAAGDQIIYNTTTTNTGDLTITVNGTAAHVKKWQGSAVLAGGDLKANVSIPMTFDGTCWQVGGNIGNAPSGNAQLHAISFVIDGGGSAIAAGALSDFPAVAYACSINRIDISADQPGSIAVDVWKAAGAIPTAADKISASAPLTLSSAQLTQNGSISGWTTSVSSGDVFGFSVASATTVTHVNGTIWCQ
jgi:hypothetical protein